MQRKITLNSIHVSIKNKFLIKIILNKKEIFYTSLFETNKTKPFFFENSIFNIDVIPGNFLCKIHLIDENNNLFAESDLNLSLKGKLIIPLNFANNIIHKGKITLFIEILKLEINERSKIDRKCESIKDSQIDFNREEIEKESSNIAQLKYNEFLKKNSNYLLQIEETVNSIFLEENILKENIHISNNSYSDS